MSVNIETPERWAHFIKNVGLILGIPVLIIVGVHLYNLRIDALKQHTALLKETQYDKALGLIQSQRKIYEIERSQLEKELSGLKTQAQMARADRIVNRAFRKMNELEEMFLREDKLRAVAEVLEKADRKHMQHLPSSVQECVRLMDYISQHKVDAATSDAGLTCWYLMRAEGIL